MKKAFVFAVILMVIGCSASKKQDSICDVNGFHETDLNQIWLSHEHILVDFVGADYIQNSNWDHNDVIKDVTPNLIALKEYNVNYFVDATPKYLGRDVVLLEKISKLTGLKIVTNTGFYGVQNNKFIPEHLKSSSAEDLSKEWISEFENGIDGTSIKPGFIKIGVDNADTLSVMHQKLVKAAAYTHLKTGLTIGSHTGKAKGLWSQLEILEKMGVSPKAFIWVHAQAETNNNNYLEAAKLGCWISLDGVGSNLEKHVEKILYAKKNGILNQILISHDAGWYDPQKEEQAMKPYTAIFEKLYPELKSLGFTDEEFNLLISVNPSKAFTISIRK